MKTNAVKTVLPLVLKFYFALTANNALAMRFSVCTETHAVVKPRMVFPWCWSSTQH
jgi:hypothetical protein